LYAYLAPNSPCVHSAIAFVNWEVDRRHKTVPTLFSDPIPKQFLGIFPFGGNASEQGEATHVLQTDVVNEFGDKLKFKKTVSKTYLHVSFPVVEISKLL
jgi:hypothetical protein